MLLVVTPTLGRSNFLGETVSSVAAIRKPHNHVLVCPATHRERLAGAYPNCVVVAESVGVCSLYQALNEVLLGSARSWDWFTYINDDDLLLEGFSDLCDRHLREGDSSTIAYGDTFYIDRHNTRLFRMPRETKVKYFESLMRRSIPPLIQQGTLISREAFALLGGYSPEFRLCADHEFFVRALFFGVGFRHYPYRVGAFRLSQGQLSGNTEEMRKECALILERHFPERAASWEDRGTLYRFRLLNWRSYLGRMKTLGWRRSHDLLRCPPE